MRYDGEYFAKALRVKRAELGITKQELAERTGLSTVQITNYEKQRNIPSFWAAVAFADAFGCSLDELVVND